MVTSDRSGERVERGREEAAGSGAQVAGKSSRVERVYGAAPRGRAGAGLAATPMSRVVQRKANASAAAGTNVAAGASTSAATAAAAGTAAAQVSLAITWRGVFGSDLSANVMVQRQTGKDAWETLTSAQVADPDGAAGAPGAQLSTTLKADRHDRYRIVVEPTAQAPDNRYQRTSKEIVVKAEDTSKSVAVKLEVNRWNLKNVDDAWEKKNIDPARAADTVQTTLFGRKITVNRLVLPRVQRTDELFRALPEATQAEIVASIAIMGGYARRTTVDGTFSNHSTGCAIDINYNMDTRQNFHFHDKEHEEHLAFVEAVVKSDPVHAGFFINRHKGQKQLEASRVFNRQFPRYVLGLLDMEVPAELDQAEVAVLGLANPFLSPEQLQAFTSASQLFAQVRVADLQAALKKTTDSTKKTKLRQVIKYWSLSRAWIEGRNVYDEVDKKNKKLVGMIPLHEELLRIFLDAGWSWGGDWRLGKDYMHFEDEQAARSLERSSSSNQGQGGT